MRYGLNINHLASVHGGDRLRLMPRLVIDSPGHRQPVNHFTAHSSVHEACAALKRT